MHLTFDCYGTLIDWEKGILASVAPLFERVGRAVPAEAILRSFVAHEARLEAESWRPYREILRAVLIEMAADLNLSLLHSESNLLSDLLPHWPPFPDTVSSLQSLSKRFRLVILSNTDDALFAETQKRLGVQFDEIITAERVKSYKPGKAHFQEALRRLNVPVSQVLHVAQSLYHDHVPAQELGFRTAWINRPSLLAGTGLAPGAHVEPDLVFSDLASLAARANAGALECASTNSTR
jgi:2-haloacid dehalogenase